MIRIHITAEAYAAILDGRDPDSVIEAHRSAQGGYFLWLDLFTMAKLKAARGPREGYSDTILRLAAEAA